MTVNAEAKLIQRLLSKDESALHEFYSVYKPALFNYLLRTLEVEDAEEVLQDAFVHTLEALRNFRGQSSLKTFLYSIAKRKAIDKIRRKKIKKVLFSYLPKHFVESIAAVFLKDDLDQQFLEHKIEKVFTHLPNDYAHVLRLKYTDGLKVNDISEKINLSTKATESLLFRARKAFIKAYATYDRQNLLPIAETIR